MTGLRASLGVGGRRSVIGIVVLAMAVVSACGSSSKGSSATATSAAGSAAGSAATSGNQSCSSVPGITPTEVKVGILNNQTGALAPATATFTPAAQARFQLANDNGGVNGRKIVSVAADGQSSQGTALSAGQGLVESNGVFALVVGDNASAPLYTYLVKSNVPVFTSQDTFPQQATATNLFSTIGAYTTSPTTGPIVKFLKDQSIKSIAILTHNAAVTIDLSNAYTAGAEQVGINTVLQYHAVPFTAFDATTLALQVKAAKPEGVISPDVCPRRDLDHQGPPTAGLYAETEPIGIGV